jgi:hypothetical protein
MEIAGPVDQPKDCPEMNILGGCDHERGVKSLTSVTSYTVRCGPSQTERIGAPIMLGLPLILPLMAATGRLPRASLHPI